MKKYYKGISILEIEPKRSDIEIIDIRRPLEIKIFSLEGIRAIPMGELLSSPGKYLEKDKTYYLLCRTGRRTTMMTVYLRKMGYDAVNLEGGIKALYPEADL